MESLNLEDRFQLTPDNPRRYFVEIAGKQLPIAPDHVIEDRLTQRPLIFFGVKKSFRERWKTDDRDSALTKIKYPETIWIEIIDKEHFDDTNEQIVRHISRTEKKSSFDMVCSTSVADTIKIMFDKVETFLKIKRGLV